MLIRSIYRAMIRVLGQAIREGPWVVGQPRERVPRISDPIGIYSLLFGRFTLRHIENAGLEKRPELGRYWWVHAVDNGKMGQFISPLRLSAWPIVKRVPNGEHWISSQCHMRGGVGHTEAHIEVCYRMKGG